MSRPAGCEVASGTSTEVDVAQLLEFASVCLRAARELEASVSGALVGFSGAWWAPGPSSAARRAAAQRSLTTVATEAVRLGELGTRVRVAALAYQHVEEQIARRNRAVLVPPLGSLAGQLAGLYPQRPARLDPPVELAERDAPTSVADLLALVEAEEGAPPGRVDVFPVGDGNTYVVALAGTSSWDLPGGQTPEDIRDLHADLEMIHAAPTAELVALPSAIAAAGVPDGARIVLVGHSLGGMTAYAAAGDAALRERYSVAMVVTAGSPLATLSAPGVPVLSLENAHDPVPSADLTPPLGESLHTTVTFDGPRRSPHDLTGYLAAAGAMGGCVGDPAARARLGELGALLRSPAGARTRGRRVVLRRVAPAAGPVQPP